MEQEIIDYINHLFSLGTYGDAGDIWSIIRDHMEVPHNYILLEDRTNELEWVLYRIDIITHPDTTNENFVELYRWS